MAHLHMKQMNPLGNVENMPCVSLNRIRGRMEAAAERRKARSWYAERAERQRLSRVVWQVWR